MKMKTLLPFFITSISLHISLAFDFDLVHWEFPPYVYTRNNKVQGIYKETWDYMDNTCNHTGSLRPKVRLGSYKEFNDLLSDGTISINYTQHRDLKNAKGSLAAWFPILANGINVTSARKKGLHYYTMFSVRGFAIFARREDITLTYKIYLSLKESWTFLVLLLTLCAIPAALAIWLLEHRQNEGLKSNFIHGSLTAFWFSLVTMTTVGYGDVVSKSFLGRFITVLWMLFGLIIASLMTALASEGYYQTRHLGIKDNTVGVLKGSFERDTVKNNWDCILKEFDSYEEVLQGLREGVTKIAVINAETAAFLQDDINTKKTSDVALSIVEIIEDISIAIGAYMQYVKFPDSRDTLDCMEKAQSYGIKNAEIKHKRKPEVERIYFPTLSQLLLEENIWLVLLIAIGSMILIGITIDLLCFTKVIKVKGWFYKNEDKTEPTANDENNSMEFQTLSECIDELCRLGGELTSIKDELDSITQSVAKDTIRKPNHRKNIFSVEDKLNEMMY